jgi:hypothetical protein
VNKSRENFAASELSHFQNFVKATITEASAT